MTRSLAHASTPAPTHRPTPTPAGPVLPGQRLADSLDDAVSGMVHAAEGRWWLLPATAFVVLAVMLAWQTGRARLHRWQHQRLTTHAQQVLINPPPEVDPAGVRLWWANLAGILRPSPWRRLVYGTPHIGLEYRWSGRQLRIVVWVPGTVTAGPVVDAVHAAWPGASAVIEDAAPPLPVAVPGRTAALRPPAAGPSPRIVREAGGALVPLLPAWCPSAGAADHGVDPLRALIAAGSGLNAGEAACVQILARPAVGQRPAVADQQAVPGAVHRRPGRPRRAAGVLAVVGVAAAGVAGAGDRSGPGAAAVVPAARLHQAHRRAADVVVRHDPGALVIHAGVSARAAARTPGRPRRR